MREMARKAAVFAGQGGSVSLEWRNLSSLPAAEPARLRTAFEAALRQAGARSSPQPAGTSLRLTLSENPSQLLLVGEARQGEQRQTWIEAWPRGRANPAFSATLEKKLLWEQDEAVLDAALSGSGMALLTPSRLEAYERSGVRWQRVFSLALPQRANWPRDLRGRLRVSGAQLQAFLPGLACTAAWRPDAVLECKPADAPWTLDAGPHALLLAQFAAERNFFDGRVVTQSGERKTLPPFYSAVAVEDSGAPYWALTPLDGPARVYNSAFLPVGEADGWGSDAAPLAAVCAPGGLALATRAGGGVSDALQAFRFPGGAASEFTQPLEMPGPVTALWGAGASGAIAVSHVSSTGKYAVFLVTASCGE